MSRQAVRTKYVPATTHRGSRIVAYCDAKMLFKRYDCSVGTDENHRAAALHLMRSLGRLENGEPQLACGWIGNECFWVEV